MSDKAILALVFLAIIGLILPVIGAIEDTKQKRHDAPPLKDSDPCVDEVVSSPPRCPHPRQTLTLLNMGNSEGLCTCIRADAGP